MAATGSEEAGERLTLDATWIQLCASFPQLRVHWAPYTNINCINVCMTQCNPGSLAVGPSRSVFAAHPCQDISETSLCSTTTPRLLVGAHVLCIIPARHLLSYHRRNRDAELTANACALTMPPVGPPTSLRIRRLQPGPRTCDCAFRARAVAPQRAQVYKMPLVGTAPAHQPTSPHRPPPPASQTMSSPSLFTPKQVGNLLLAHRIVLAPLTRLRADNAHVHGDLALEYYTQRASAPGTLLITEATFIAPRAGGYPGPPGIWNQAQIDAWKKITAAVHARGSFVFLQLWALGRCAMPEVLAAEDAALPYVSSSASPRAGTAAVPRPLTVAEIAEYAQLYAAAASNAVHGAGFDGVEIHAANGYLLDQFLQDVVNVRTDAYGGSIENRTRFPLAVIDAVVDAVGAERTAVRLSPWSKWQGMGMADPVPTFAHLIREVRARHPHFAYLHLIQPRIVGDEDEAPSSVAEAPAHPAASNDFARALWAPKPLVVAGAFTPASASAHAAQTGDLVAFGRYFISNPDLPMRIANGVPLAPYDRSTFYYMDPTKDPTKGYIDYPFTATVEGAKAS